MIYANDADEPEAGAAITPAVAKAFAAHGWLHDALGMAHRAGQARMAAGVAAALEGDRAFLVEAGTGVGKSLAYLIPGVLYAMEHKRQCVVSTHTIPLQEQILHKDLAICRKLFAAVPELKPYAGFKHALLVGRGNYLCTTRLAKALAEKGNLFGEERYKELQALAEWVTQTKSGLREELGGGVSDEVWEWVNADSSACNNRDCKPDTCPYRRARAAQRAANVLVVNHSLLFALMAAGVGPKGGDAKGILSPNDFLILDEAHTVPEVATTHFGTRVSSYAVDRTLKQLWGKSGKRGLLARFRKEEDGRLVGAALAASEVFFNQVREQWLTKRPEARFVEPNWAEPHLNLPLKHLEDRLGKLFEIETNQTQKAELGDYRKRLGGYRNALNDALLLADAEDEVYWAEIAGRKRSIVAVNAAPIDVAPILRDKLFGAGVPVIMTSATLSNGADMDRFIAQCGAPASVRRAIEPSPFDYPRVMRIYASSDAPEPRAAAGRGPDLDYAATVAEHAIRTMPGGTLVLCTANTEMLALRDRLETALAGEREVFCQGGELSRTELIARFRASGDGVLLGVSSFWTGVDIPGTALSQLILTRLPFENPGAPVASARAERIESEGRSAFAEMMLPDALIRFRQGVGRLIRTTEDRGRVVILDSRLMTKQYGKRFVAALPPGKLQVFTIGTLRERITPWV